VVLPVVVTVNVETLEITRQVIEDTRIKVPIMLGGGGRCSVAGTLVLIIALAAVHRFMPLVLAYLTLGAPAAVSSSIEAVAAVVVVAATILATLVVGALAVASLGRAALPLRDTARGTTATRVGGVTLRVVGVDRA
jgi:hypothetical protein